MPKRRATGHTPGKTKDKNGREMPRDPSKDLAFRNFSDSLDRERFLEVLSHNDPESKWGQLFQFMMDPGYQRHSIARLCRMLNISLQDLMEMWRDVAIAEGTVRMMEHLPQVMADVGQDARSRMKPCPRCDGEGTIENAKLEDGDDPKVALTKLCPECKGKGEVREVGDKHARDLMFESAGMTNKKVPLVAQQFNINSSGLRPVMEQTQDLLEPGK